MVDFDKNVHKLREFDFSFQNDRWGNFEYSVDFDAEEIRVFVIKGIRGERVGDDLELLAVERKSEVQVVKGLEGVGFLLGFLLLIDHWL